MKYSLDELERMRQAINTLLFRNRGMLFTDPRMAEEYNDRRRRLIDAELRIHMLNETPVEALENKAAK